jgi:hypothetical protein
LKANPTHSPFKCEDQAEQEGRQRKSESQVCQGLAIEVETQRAKCAVIEYPPRDPRSQQDRRQGDQIYKQGVCGITAQDINDYHEKRADNKHESDCQAAVKQQPP